MRCAQVKDGVVINTILAEPGFNPGDGSIIVPSEEAQIGWLYGGHLFPPPESEPEMQAEAEAAFVVDEKPAK